MKKKEITVTFSDERTVPISQSGIPPFIDSKRPLRIEQERTIEYGNFKIKGYIEVYDRYDIIKQQDTEVKKIICEIYEGGKFVLNMGECIDGSKFTTVGQAINQTKIALAYILKGRQLGQTFLTKS